MFNFVDVLIFILVIYLIWQGFRVGLIGGLLNVLSTIASFVIASLAYPYIGELFRKYLNVNENVAPVAGFIAALVILEFGLNLLLTYFYSKIAPLYKKSKTVKAVDMYLGIFPSVLVGLFLVSLLMLLVLTLPVKDWLRDPIQQSWWGRNVVSRGLGFVPIIEKTLNRIPYKNLVYIVTPENPNSEESQGLNLPENIKIKEDPQAEKELFDLVNKERKARGLKEVLFDNPLRDVGREHCRDMFNRRYFSHYSPEGESPFDRIDEAGIEYLAAGENLAYAPSVSIAHQGLMNSPGHKENILREEFGKLGVGVIDGGVNGKMFCQEFSN